MGIDGGNFVEREERPDISLTQGQKQAIKKLRGYTAPSWISKLNLRTKEPIRLIAFQGFPGVGKSTVIENANLPINWKVDPELDSIENIISNKGKVIVAGGPGLFNRLEQQHIVRMGKDGWRMGQVNLKSMNMNEAVSLLKKIKKGDLVLPDTQIARISLGIPILLKQLADANPQDMQSAIQIAVHRTLPYGSYIHNPMDALRFLSMSPGNDFLQALEKAHDEEVVASKSQKIHEQFKQAQVRLAGLGIDLPFPLEETFDDYVKDYAAGIAGIAPLRIIATGITEEQFHILSQYFGFGEGDGSILKAPIAQAFGIGSDREYIGDVSGDMAGKRLAVGNHKHLDPTDVQHLIDQCIRQFPLNSEGKNLFFDFGDHGRMSNRELLGISTEAVLQKMGIAYFRHMENKELTHFRSDRVYDPQMQNYRRPSTKNQ